MSITIPAREVRKGDVIVLAGQGFDVTAYQHDRNRDRFTVYFHLNGDQVGNIDLPGDLMVEVERPDPDAELAVSISRAIFDADAGGGKVIPDIYIQFGQIAVETCRSAGRLS